jgi:hypothetical protein
MVGAMTLDISNPDLLNALFDSEGGLIFRSFLIPHQQKKFVTLHRQKKNGRRQRGSLLWLSLLTLAVVYLFIGKPVLNFLASTIHYVVSLYQHADTNGKLAFLGAIIGSTLFASMLTFLVTFIWRIIRRRRK